MGLSIFIVAAARRLRTLDRARKRPPKPAPRKKARKRTKRAHQAGAHRPMTLAELAITVSLLAGLGLVASRLGLSAIPAYLLAGLPLGPNEPEALSLVRSSEVTDFVAEIGLVFLLFFLGLSSRSADSVAAGSTPLSAAQTFSSMGLRRLTTRVARSGRVMPRKVAQRFSDFESSSHGLDLIGEHNDPGRARFGVDSSANTRRRSRPR